MISNRNSPIPFNPNGGEPGLRFGQRWSEDEDYALLWAVAKGEDLQRIAARHQRSMIGCDARLMTLAER